MQSTLWTSQMVLVKKLLGLILLFAFMPSNGYIANHSSIYAIHPLPIFCLYHSILSHLVHQTNMFVYFNVTEVSSLACNFENLLDT